MMTNDRRARLYDAASVLILEVEFEFVRDTEEKVGDFRFEPLIFHPVCRSGNAERPDNPPIGCNYGSTDGSESLDGFFAAESVPAVANIL